MTYRGLTWDHPRGFVALDRASKQEAADKSPLRLRWETQPLEGFESESVEKLAARYDLLVMDHPHVGSAVASDCLHPLERFFSDNLLNQWQRQSVGAASRSYFWNGRHWALPLDVAVQVLAYRDDLLDEDPPGSWEDVLQLARRKPVALSIAGPHAFLNLLSICAALGDGANDEHLFDVKTATEALKILQTLYALVPLNTEQLNPIALHARLSSSDDITLIPLVFGYVNYARAEKGRERIQFRNAPKSGYDQQPGSVLGGTGIAISKRCTPDAALLDHLCWLMSADTQTEFIPDHAGQPSAKVAWQDDALNATWNNFYRSTLTTVEHAIVRPRCNHYVGFQAEAADIVRSALVDATPARDTAARISAQWQRLNEKQTRIL